MILYIIVESYYIPFSTFSEEFGILPGIEKVQENAPTHRLARKIKSTKLGIHS